MSLILEAKFANDHAEQLGFASSSAEGTMRHRESLIFFCLIMLVGYVSDPCTSENNFSLPCRMLPISR